MTSPVYKAIILDFDGVIVESNSIKDKAFAAVFADYPQHLDAIMTYHYQVTAIRFEKFRHVYEQILRKPYDAATEQRLGEQFSQFCTEQIAVCPMVTGAQEFLDHFAGRVPLYLVTINPKADIDEILSHRRLVQYFKKIYTVTGSKKAAIDEIIALENITKKEAVFIGDSQGDYTSASAAGVDFIGRQSGMGLQAPRMFGDMVQILGYLKALV